MEAIRRSLMKGDSQFVESEVKSLCIGENSYQLKNIEEDFGVSLIDAYNGAPIMRFGYRKTRAYALASNISSVTITMQGAMQLYVNGILYKEDTLNGTKTYTIENPQNNNNYIITYYGNFSWYGPALDGKNCIAVFLGSMKSWNPGGKEVNNKIRNIFYIEDISGENFSKLYGCNFRGRLIIPEGLVINDVRYFMNNTVDEIVIPIDFQTPEPGKACWYDANNIKKVIYKGSLRDYITRRVWWGSDWGGFAKEGCALYPGAKLYLDNQDVTPIESVIVPLDVHIIEQCAFLKQTQITTIEIHSGVTQIKAGAFYGCSTPIINVDLRLDYLGGYAFYNCKGLRGKIALSDSVTTIGSNAFYGCSGLSEVVLSDAITTIGANTFYGCSGLSEVVLSDAITTIGEKAFYNCKGLREVHIPKNLRQLSYETFYGCPLDQEEIYIPKECKLYRNGYGWNRSFMGVKHIRRYIVDTRVESILPRMTCVNADYVDLSPTITTLVTGGKDSASIVYVSSETDGVLIVRGETLAVLDGIYNKERVVFYGQEQFIQQQQIDLIGFKEYRGFIMVTDLPTTPIEGKYYYAEVNNHLYKYEGGWTDITATYV